MNNTIQTISRQGLFAIVVMVTCLAATARAENSSPFAVGGTARKALPALECWGCYGPAPCVPCECDQRGFIYYGTCAEDDDCKNGWNDCPRGDCGHRAVGISLWWMRLHKHCRLPWCQRPPSTTTCTDNCSGGCNR